MAAYWCVIDKNEMKKFGPPKDFSIKSPGIFNPESPFPAMVIMMNSLGYNYELISDDNENEYYNEKLKDITEEVYNKLLHYYPWAKEKIYESKEK